MANGRIGQESTPEGRLAAAAKMAADKARKENKHEADYADYREILKPYVQRELILARIEEARRDSAFILSGRIIELSKDLYEVEKQIPPECRLWSV